MRGAQVGRDIERGHARNLKDSRRRRIGGGQRDRAFDHQVLGQLALLLHFVQHPDQAEVGGEHAADAEVAGAAHVLDGVDELVGAAMLQADDLAGRGRGLRPRLERRARPDKQADLDALALADAGHLLDVSLAEQQHAASLAHAVDRHLVLFRGLEHGTEHARPFDARDFEPVLPAVGKALLGGLERVIVLDGEFELGEKLLGLLHCPVSILSGSGGWN